MILAEPLGIQDRKSQAWEFGAPETFLRAARQDVQAAEALRHIHRAGAVQFYVDAMHHALQALLIQAHSDEEELINGALELLSKMDLMAEPAAAASSLRRTYKTNDDATYPTGSDHRTQHERLTEIEVEQVRRTSCSLIDLVKVAVVELSALDAASLGTAASHAA